MRESTRASAGELQSRLFANAAKLFSATTLSSLIGICSFVVTARALGPTEFGMLILVVTFGNAVVRLCAFQSWQALIKFASEHLSAGAQGKAAAIFRFGFALDAGAAVVAGLITVSGASWAAELFQWRPEVAAGVVAYAIAVVFNLAGAATAALRLFDRFGVIGFQQVVSALFKLAVVAAVFAYSPTLESFLYAWIASHVFAHVLLNGLALVTLNQRNLLRNGSHPAKIRDVVSRPVVRYLITTNLDGMVRVVRELDGQLVALFVDEAAAGVVRIGRQIASFVGRLVDAFFEAIYPQLMTLVNERDWDLLAVFVRRSSLQVGFVALLALAGFVLVGKPFLGIVFGDAYLDAYLPTVAFISAMAIWGFAQPYSPALMALGAVRRMLLNHVIASFVYLALLIYLVPVYSVLGAGFAMVGLFAVWGALTVLGYLSCRPVRTGA